MKLQAINRKNGGVIDIVPKQKQRLEIMKRLRKPQKPMNIRNVA